MARAEAGKVSSDWPEETPETRWQAKELEFIILGMMGKY